MIKNLIAHVNLAKGFRGGERQTALLIEQLAADGWPQCLVTRADSPLPERLNHVPHIKFVKIRKPYWLYLAKLHSHNPTILHAHDGKGAHWAMLYNWRYHTPYIITRRVINPLGRGRFTQAVYQRASQIIALSSAIKERILERLPGLKVDIIPSMYANLPIDLNHQMELRKRFQSYFVIGHIGALVDRHKGQSVLIAAMRRLHKEYPEMRCLLIGDGEDRDKLRKLATGLDCIEFIGFVEDVGNWISCFDLFVFPSFEEGLGSTLLDVMQQNKPIIASSTGGIVDIIQHQHNGLLVPPGDVGELAGAIALMYQKPALRNRLVNNAQLGLKRYDPEALAATYQHYYQKILSIKQTNIHDDA